MCKELKLPWKEFEKRMANDALFEELVTFGRLASKAWWLKLGRKCAVAGAPSQAFSFWDKNMKNRFGWTDKTEEKDGKETSELSTDVIVQKIHDLKQRIAKKPANVEMASLLKETVN